MSTAKYTDEEALVTKAVDALLKELGPVDTMRFVAMPRKRRMDAVKRHREWQKTLKKEQFLKEVFMDKEASRKRRAESGGSRERKREGIKEASSEAGSRRKKEGASGKQGAVSGGKKSEQGGGGLRLRAGFKLQRGFVVLEGLNWAEFA